MKLMLGETELADIPDDVARQLVGIFQTPGYMSAMPTTASIERPEQQVGHFGESSLVQLIERSKLVVTLELTATFEHRGPMFDTRDRREVL